jgi:cytoskeletal protein RodZ
LDKDQATQTKTNTSKNTPTIMKPRASNNTMAAILNGVFVVILCILWYSNIVLLDQGEVHRVTTKHPQPQQQTFRTSRKTTTTTSTSSSPNQDEYTDDKPLVDPPIYSTTTTTATTKNDNRTTTADFHIVFSTGCNAFQDCE